MTEIIPSLELLRGRGRPPNSATQAEESGYEQLEKDPSIIIEELSRYGGDIELMLTNISGGNITKTRMLSRILLILGKPEHAQLKSDWDRLVRSYKTAKIMRAERAAFEFIGSLEDIVKEEDGTKKLSAYTTFAKMWLSPHAATELALAKQRALEGGIQEESMGLRTILEKLSEPPE